jgi:hypothetical protein
LVSKKKKNSCESANGKAEKEEMAMKKKLILKL